MIKIIEIATGYTSIPAKIGAATEIVVEELSKAFIQSGYKVTVLDIADKNRSCSELPIQEISVPFLRNKVTTNLGLLHKIKRVLYSVLLAFRLIKMLRKEEHLILHFHNQYNLFFFLKLTSGRLRAKATILYTNHSYIWSRPWSEISKDIQRRYFQEIYAMQNADRIYVLNQQSYENIVSYVGVCPDKIKVLPNGVNTNIYKPISSIDGEIKEIKHQNSIHDKMVFLNVGSICDRKNQLGILKQLTPVLQQNGNCKFLFAGGIIDTEYYNQLLSYATAQGIREQVVYLGEISPGQKLNEYYNLADYLIFCSKSEGFSLVVLEALSAGLPVILSENLMNDFLRVPNNGIIQVKDESELSFIIPQIIKKDCRATYSSDAYNFIRSRLDWQSVSQKIITDVEKIRV